MEEGDLIALLTDGLTEVFDANGDELGSGVIEDILVSSADCSLAEIHSEIFSKATHHGLQDDDQTLILARRSSHI